MYYVFICCVRPVKNWSPAFIMNTYKLGVLLSYEGRKVGHLFRIAHSYIWEVFNVQVGETEMVKGLKGSDLPEPWFGKKSKALTEAKRTTPTSRGVHAQQVLDAETEGQCTNIGKGRGKGKKKVNTAAKGKLGRTGPANVMLGRTKNPVADPTELRWKRIEDAIACGRVVKSIVHPAKRRSCPRTADIECSDPNAEDVLAAEFNEIGSGSPSAVEKIALSGGKQQLRHFHTPSCIYI